MKKTNSNASGEGLVILIILIAVLGGGLWWLAAHKQTMDKAGRTFGRDVIQSLVVNHDVTFLANNLSPQEKLNLPPSELKLLIDQMTQLGVPAPGFQIEETMSWEGWWVFKFFEPHGSFAVHLNYPSGPAILQVMIDH